MNVDIEALLVVWFPTVLTTVRPVTDLPANLSGAVPLVRLVRVGGPDIEPGIDRATVDVEWFDADRVKASALARAGHWALRLSLPGYATADGSVSRVQTVSGPAWRPYDDMSVRRFGATYQITTHSAQPV